MKIKYPLEHDTIVSWITENPETFLKSIGINDSYETLKYKRQCQVYDKNKYVGDFDILLSLNKPDGFIYEGCDENGERIFQYTKVYVIVNVKLDSATEQLRELKKIRNQQLNNTSQFSQKSYFVIVSENDKFKSFFTDENILFYKF